MGDILASSSAIGIITKTTVTKIDQNDVKTSLVLIVGRLFINTLKEMKKSTITVRNVQVAHLNYSRGNHLWKSRI